MVGGMQQIADWLKKLGMFEYGLPFAENHADSRVVCEFTDQDLKVRTRLYALSFRAAKALRGSRSRSAYTPGGGTHARDRASHDIG